MRRGRPGPLLALLALVAASAIVACGGARPSARRGPAAKPPPIVERFKPLLPCDPSTTTGMLGCGERRTRAADRRLDADVTVILAALTHRARAHLLAAQRAWLAYRAADCRSQEDVYGGGSEEPVVYVRCLAADDAARRAQLSRWYRELADGGRHMRALP
jgi:uncharacterized protein YecT (DUF1311 family)